MDFSSVHPLLQDWIKTIITFSYVKPFSCPMFHFTSSLPRGRTNFANLVKECGAASLLFMPNKALSPVCLFLLLHLGSHCPYCFHWGPFDSGALHKASSALCISFQDISNSQFRRSLLLTIVSSVISRRSESELLCRGCRWTPRGSQ